ncbi:hypothetical protein D9758_006368 [Tetrapyrgos nigripes]|uniref:Uncharacterized protein n=1 Tax=Tetrapyrgos nigripes TaxID=182062 RepID=A0A8H5G0J4_9AGAR|nr:hypothetical protein D9758_006368 [Tetrapyrgos nigripes]
MFLFRDVSSFDIEDVLDGWWIYLRMANLAAVLHSGAISPLFCNFLLFFIIFPFGVVRSRGLEILNTAVSVNHHLELAPNVELTSGPAISNLSAPYSVTIRVVQSRPSIHISKVKWSNVVFDSFQFDNSRTDSIASFHDVEGIESSSLTVDIPDGCTSFSSVVEDSEDDQVERRFSVADPDSDGCSSDGSDSSSAPDNPPPPPSSTPTPTDIITVTTSTTTKITDSIPPTQPTTTQAPLPASTTSLHQHTSSSFPDRSFSSATFPSSTQSVFKSSSPTISSSSVTASSTPAPNGTVISNDTPTDTSHGPSSEPNNHKQLLGAIVGGVLGGVVVVVACLYGLFRWRRKKREINSANASPKGMDSLYIWDNRSELVSSDVNLLQQKIDSVTDASALEKNHSVDANAISMGGGVTKPSGSVFYHRSDVDKFDDFNHNEISSIGCSDNQRRSSRTPQPGSRRHLRELPPVPVHSVSTGSTVPGASLVFPSEVYNSQDDEIPPSDTLQHGSHHHIRGLPPVPVPGSHSEPQTEFGTRNVPLEGDRSLLGTASHPFPDYTHDRQQLQTSARIALVPTENTPLMMVDAGRVRYQQHPQHPQHQHQDENQNQNQWNWGLERDRFQAQIQVLMLENARLATVASGMPPPAYEASRLCWFNTDSLPQIQAPQDTEFTIDIPDDGSRNLQVDVQDNNGNDAQQRFHIADASSQQCNNEHASIVSTTNTPSTTPQSTSSTTAQRTQPNTPVTTTTTPPLSSTTPSSSSNTPQTPSLTSSSASTLTSSEASAVSSQLSSASTVPTSTASNTSTTTASPSTESGSRRRKELLGAIMGGVLGGILLTVSCFLGFLFLRRRMKREKRLNQIDPFNPGNDDEERDLSRRISQVPAPPGLPVYGVVKDSNSTKDFDVTSNFSGLGVDLDTNRATIVSRSLSVDPRMNDSLIQEAGSRLSSLEFGKKSVMPGHLPLGREKTLPAVRNEPSTNVFYHFQESEDAPSNQQHRNVSSSYGAYAAESSGGRRIRDVPLSQGQCNDQMDRILLAEKLEGLHAKIDFLMAENAGAGRLPPPAYA